jgi:hypothetical protein
MSKKYPSKHSEQSKDSEHFLQLGRQLSHFCNVAPSGRLITVGNEPGAQSLALTHKVYPFRVVK